MLPEEGARAPLLGQGWPGGGGREGTTGDEEWGGEQTHGDLSTIIKGTNTGLQRPTEARIL